MSGLSTYFNARAERGFVTGHQGFLFQYGALG
jgi:hypothetical protein